MKRRIATLVVGACLAGVLTGGTASQAQAASCYTPDGIAATSYVSGDAVSRINGTVYYAGSRSGNYSVALSDLRRNDAAVKLWVQFLAVGGLYWRDRVEVGALADGYGPKTISKTFSKTYAIEKISFGTGQVGASQYTIAWDRNSPCGA